MASISAAKVPGAVCDFVGIDAHSTYEIARYVADELAQFILMLSFTANEAAKMHVARSCQAKPLCGRADTANNLGDGLLAIVECAHKIEDPRVVSRRRPNHRTSVHPKEPRVRTDTAPKLTKWL